MMPHRQDRHEVRSILHGDPLLQQLMLGGEIQQLYVSDQSPQLQYLQLYQNQMCNQCY